MTLFDTAALIEWALIVAAALAVVALACALTGPAWLAAPSGVTLAAGLLHVAASRPGLAWFAVATAAAVVAAVCARFGTAESLDDDAARINTHTRPVNPTR